MAVENNVYIAGAFEHPLREAPNKSSAQLHAEVGRGALADAGLSTSEVDGYLSAEGPGVISLADYIGLENISFFDSTDIGGASYITHVGHAAAAISTGRCRVALVTLAGRPKSNPQNTGNPRRDFLSQAPEAAFEDLFGTSTVGKYALAARRHMHEYGTTSEQLAEIRVAASHHAQFNENAMYQNPVTVEDVVNSRMIADPLHLLDCCVISDGGGALVVVDESIAKRLNRNCVEVLGFGESLKHSSGGNLDITYTGATESGPRAFDEAGVSPEEIDYASIYDSFTITVLESIEDLGFCPKGDGGKFVEGGALKAPKGKLPINTDGGGLCNNHPANRGGVTKVIEAVRQLRGEANPEVQVPDCRLALAHGTGGSIGTRMGCATLILGGGAIAG